MVTWAKQAWRDLVAELFDNNGLDTVFSHARNVLTGAAVIAAGMYAANHMGTEYLRGTWTIRFAGHAVAGLGGIVLALNLFDGLRRLAKRKHHVLLRIAAIFIYVALSMRLTQVIIYFRAVV